MDFTIAQSIEVLERTPDVLFHFLKDLSPEWTSNNEGGETWSAYDVVGHLIHADKTDWMVRVELILSDGADKRFESFDRLAQFEDSKGKTLMRLLDEFRTVRAAGIKRLCELNISATDLNKTGIHPTFGTVTLSKLLSTWVVHDLDHIAQISRVMAKQYKEAVGPWIEFLKVLRH